MKKILFAALLLLSNIAFADTPESGWWWNPDEPGSGFNIEVQRDRVFVATFVYDEDGNPVWYSGSGKLINSRVMLTLIRFQGGPCIDCPYQGPPEAAEPRQLTLRFTSPWQGVANWGGRNTEKIERFNFSFGGWPRSMMGEWAFISKEPDSSGNYKGVRVTFDHLVDANTLTGSVMQVGYKKATLGVMDVNRTEHLCCYVRIDFPNGLSNFYAFALAGYNKIQGIVALISTDADKNSIKFALENHSSSFEAYRVH